MIKQHHINDKYINMSASETSCLMRNIRVSIGEYVPEDNEYWKIIILLKEILDFVTVPLILDSIADYLERLISEYL